MISIRKEDYNTTKLAVVLLHFNENAEILAVSRKDNPNDFGLVGGKVDPTDETLLDAIKRESLEETGLIVEHAEPIFVHTEDNGFTSITFVTHAIDGEISTTESGVVKYVDFDELCKGSFGQYNKKLKDFYYKLL